MVRSNCMTISNNSNDSMTNRRLITANMSLTLRQGIVNDYELHYGSKGKCPQVSAFPQ